MTVSKQGVEQGRVPLDDIGVLLCNAHGLTYSNNLLTELCPARRGRGAVRAKPRQPNGRRGVSLADGRSGASRN